MKNRLIAPLLLAGLVIVGSCDFLRDLEKGNGNIVLESRTISSFKSVSIGGNFQVTLEKGEKSSLKVITDENLHTFIESEVVGDKLIINQEKKLISSQKIELIVIYETLERIQIMGAAKVNSDGVIYAENLEIKMEGAGLVDIDINVEYLDVSLSGAGVIITNGEAQIQRIRLMGAGSINSFDLVSKECEIVVSGLGSAEVFATEKLEAKIEGVGRIEYAGNPENVITNISGLGKISEVSKY